MDDEIEIYSTRTCTQATAAKALLEYWQMEYIGYFPCEDELCRLEDYYAFCAPLIFVDGHLLGGLLELQEWLAYSN